MPFSLSACMALFAFSAIIITRIFFKGKRYAPGPAGLPFIGNYLDIPPVGPWNYFESLCQQYGPIVRLTLTGDEMLILGNAEDCEELLSKKSSIYSSRKPLIYAGKYRSHDKRLILLSYGDELKKQRAAFAEVLNPRAVESYAPQQEYESIKLLSAILVNPDEYKTHLKRFIASLVFTMTYGKKLNDDHNLTAVQQILVDFLPDCAPRAHLVDTFPLLDKLPDFLAPWRKKALEKYASEKALYTKLMKDVKVAMDAGTADPCLAVNLWEQHQKKQYDEETLAYLAGTLFEASIDATTGAILWFIVAMLLYPDARKTAQAELDSLLGDSDALPSLSQLRDLPYCVALVKEVFRWRPVAPGAFGHYSDADNVYKGFYIPKKTLVIPLVWAMHRDASIYDDPHTFEPKRFLGRGELNSAEVMTSGHHAFGFGRRICPARYLISKTIFLVIIRMLWAFDIEHALDMDGNPIQVDPFRSTFSVISEPLEFPVRFIPRSPMHADKIREEYEFITKA